MTPQELAARLRAAQARAAALPAAAERAVQTEVLRGIPRSVSVLVARKATGVSLVLSGRGARAHARRITPRIRSQVTQASKGVWP